MGTVEDEATGAMVVTRVAFGAAAAVVWVSIDIGMLHGVVGNLLVFVKGHGVKADRK